MSSKFEGMLNSVRMAWEGIKMKLAEKIVPALMPMLEALLQWIEQNPDKIASIIQGMSNIITGAVEAIGTVLQWAGEHWQTFEAIVVGGGLVAGLKIAAARNRISFWHAHHVQHEARDSRCGNLRVPFGVAGSFRIARGKDRPHVENHRQGRRRHYRRRRRRMGFRRQPMGDRGRSIGSAEAGGWAMGHFDPTPKAVTVNNSFAITATEDRQARCGQTHRKGRG